MKRANSEKTAAPAKRARNVAVAAAPPRAAPPRAAAAPPALPAAAAPAAARALRAGASPVPPVAARAVRASRPAAAAAPGAKRAPPAASSSAVARAEAAAAAATGALVAERARSAALAAELSTLRARQTAAAAAAAAAAARRLAELEARDAAGCTALFRAARAGDADSLRALLAGGAAAETANAAGVTALAAAVAEQYGQGRSAVVQLLLLHGADPNAQRGDVDAPMHIAAWSSDAAVMRAMLEAGGDPNLLCHADARTPLIVGCLNAGDCDEADSNDGYDDVGDAGGGRRAGALRELILAGADVNAAAADGQTALMACFAESNYNVFSVVELLVRAGADVHAADARGWTALMHAAAKAPARYVDLLLRAGARARHRALDGSSAKSVAGCQPCRWTSGSHRREGVRAILAARSEVERDVATERAIRDERRAVLEVRSEYSGSGGSGDSDFF